LEVDQHINIWIHLSPNSPAGGLLCPLTHLDTVLMCTPRCVAAFLSDPNCSIRRFLNFNLLATKPPSVKINHIFVPLSIIVRQYLTADALCGLFIGMDISEFHRRAAGLFEEKNRLYGKHNIETVGVLAKFRDKLARLEHLISGSGGTPNESITDTCLDVSNYAYIMLSLLDGSWHHGPDRSKANHTGDIHQPQKPGDVGYDLHASHGVALVPGTITWVPTGVRLLSPRGTWYSIKGRSSITKQLVLVLDNVIDTEYTGDLFVGMLNMSGNEVTIEEGDRIAQIVFFQSVCPELATVVEFPPTARGDAAYGSTGRK
jgi:dUTP pyrophosphatase